jgi:hypothetical protein
MTVLINQTPYLRSVYEDKGSYILNTWLRSVTDDELRLGISPILDLTRKVKVPYMVSDTTLVHNGWLSSHWLIDYFWPALIENGLTHFGIVLNSEPLPNSSSLRVENDLIRAGINLEYRRFSQLTDALDWIRSLQAPRVKDLPKPAQLGYLGLC